jgi:hypothetical protein
LEDNVVDKVETNEVPEEVVVGEKQFTDYKKAKFTDSAEVRMLLYVVPLAIVFGIIGFILSR